MLDMPLPARKGVLMAVSKRTRFEVLRRDDHTCRYCGQSAPDVKLTVDHVLPVGAKRWIRHTTWADLIARAAGVDA